MKVIAEERLREKFDHVQLWNMTSTELRNFLNEILEECQEIDQLTVSKLRPMSEAPRDESARMLVCLITNNELIQTYRYYARGDSWECTGGFYKDSELKGWIPMPIYKPEQP